MNKLVILLLYFLSQSRLFHIQPQGRSLIRHDRLVYRPVQHARQGIVCATYFKRTGKRILIRQYTAIRMSGQKHRGNLLFPLVDFPETFEKDTGRVHRNRIPSGCPWAGKHNGICCLPGSTFGRQVAEVFRFPQRLCVLLAEGGGDTHSYSFPVAHAIYQYCQITGNYQLLKELYPELLQNYSEWKKKNS